MVVGFGILAALIAWRAGRVAGAPVVVLGVGVALAGLALIPGIGTWVSLTVSVISALVGYLMSHVILTAIFVGVFIPISAILRVTGKDLLRLRASRGSTWVGREAGKRIESYYRQF